MTSGREQVAQIPLRVADRLTEQLAPGGWRRHRFVPDDEVAFVREPVHGVVFHLSVNLAGRDGVLLSPSVGVEHVAAAEVQRQLFGRTGTVCQVGASMRDLVNDAETSKVSLSRWWVVLPEQVDDAVAQVVADLTAYGEPFLVGNQTLPKVIEALLERPKSQVEYGSLAVCLALLGDMPEARAMLAKFGAVRRVFAGGMTETFIHNFTERFGN
ncbi:hypothetical protein [Micromonospora rhizosphaerae]|uniref:hypothetical protein n=1 Tax=Micromonospora rhizosphaerae TaxID=568872 RepID=UPI00114C9DAA|nr:hypothetical protein [Micromonospora rhizosphaerae]